MVVFVGGQRPQQMRGQGDLNGVATIKQSTTTTTTKVTVVEKVEQPSTTSNANVTHTTTLVTLLPTRVHLAGHEVIFQFPEGQNNSDCNTSTTTATKGVLFLYHGCNRHVMSFFYSPQGRDMMRAALNAGLAVVAFEKHHDVGCWSPGEDTKPILEAGKAWIEQYLLPPAVCGEHTEKLPFFGFGASSGGTFVAEVAKQTAGSGATGSGGFEFSAINVQIMNPKVELSTATVFTVMSRDERTRLGVHHVTKYLKSKGIPTHTFQTGPKKVTPEYFMNRFSDEDGGIMSQDAASVICTGLQSMGALSEDGELIKNPRSLDLGPIFEKVKSSRPYGVGEELWNVLREDEREDAENLWLVEELNVCYDQHEITAEKFLEVIAFFFENVP